jgi:hypothetical protein
LSRIFDNKGRVVLDYDKIELRLEEYVAMARKANCRYLTVNIPKAQLLYLGNRFNDALAARADKDCQVLTAED